MRKPDAPFRSAGSIMRFGSRPQGNAAGDRLEEKSATAALLLLVGVLWLATRQYHGIIHDGRLYTVQALDLLFPHRFSTDLYLRFGSQDRYTIYSFLYAPLIMAMGVSRAAIFATIAGQAIWLCGLAHMSCALFRSRLRALLAVAAAIALPSFYGMFFRYGEPFATPRLFAEGLDLFAIGFLVQGRQWWAFLMLALAVPLHPLVAVAGVAFSVIYLALQRPAWWLLFAVGTAAAGALASAGIPPFANLKLSFDQTWLDIVRALDPNCLITHWSLVAYCRTLVAMAIAALAIAATERQDRRVLISALAVGIGGVLLTLLGSDLAHNVLITQVQPWRSMWLLTVLANLYAAPVLCRLAREPARLEAARIGFVTALIPYILSQFVPPFVDIVAPLMLITASVTAWQLQTGRQLPAAVHWCVLFASAIGAIATVLLCCAFLLTLDVRLEVFPGRIAGFLLLFAALALLVLLLRRRAHPWPRHRALPFAVVLFGLSFYCWDARDAWARFVEMPGPVPPSLASLLPGNAQVYWEGGLRLLWLRLRRSSYFSCGQGAGVLFFRGTAIEFERREKSFWPLRTLDFSNQPCPPFNESEHERTRDELREVCRRELALDYVVLAWPVSGIESRTWVAPAGLVTVRQVGDRYVPFSTNRFYVYSCAGLR